MELHKRVDAVLTGELNKLVHASQIRLIVGSLFRLYTRPHYSQPDHVLSPAVEIAHVLFGEAVEHVPLLGVRHVWRRFHDDVNSMEDSLAILLVI